MKINLLMLVFLAISTYVDAETRAIAKTETNQTDYKAAGEFRTWNRAEGHSDHIYARLHVAVGYTTTCYGNAGESNSPPLNEEDSKTTDYSAGEQNATIDLPTGVFPMPPFSQWENGSTHNCIHQHTAAVAASSVILSFSIGSDFVGANISFDGDSIARQSLNKPFQMVKPASVTAFNGCISPILFDLGTLGFDLTGLDDPVAFDLDADGVMEISSWTDQGPNDGFLVLDRNSNGLVDDALELFGNFTRLQDGSLAEHGYEALAELDSIEFGGNDNGRIDMDDDFYGLLQIWMDLNHNGISEEKELSSLWDAGILSADLAFVESVEQDEHGNLFKYLSTALACGNSECSEVEEIVTTDVFFRVNDPNIALTMSSLGGFSPSYSLNGGPAYICN